MFLCGSWKIRAMGLKNTRAVHTHSTHEKGVRKMMYTYKLDERGIPYRVLQPENGQERMDEKEPQQEKGLLRHSGKLQHFQLYIF